MLDDMYRDISKFGYSFSVIIPLSPLEVIASSQQFLCLLAMFHCNVFKFWSKWEYSE